MITKFGILIVAVAVFLFGSCRPKINDMGSLYQWINNPENGLVKTKTVEGISLIVKYLPPQYLALKETKQSNAPEKRTYDSLYRVYQQTHTFLLTIAPVDSNNDNDPMYHGLESYAEYKQRALTMNFDMNEFVSIRVTNDEFRPVLTSMENTYGLKGQRNIYLVFTDESIENKLMKEEELDFVFKDEIFETGINHFVFRQDDLRGTPEFDFNDIIN